MARKLSQLLYVTATLALALWLTPAGAQMCVDGNQCTDNDMCVDGMCSGTPIEGSCNDGNPCTSNDMCAGGMCQGTPNTNPCDDGNPCTTNDTCAATMCVGTPVADETPCGDLGCEGACMTFGGNFTLCVPDPNKQMDPCTPIDPPGACFEPQCLVTSCVSLPKLCNNDGNLCTIEFCDPVNPEQCLEPIAVACPDCSACNPETGVCSIAIDDGQSCDDGDVCTGDGTCSEGDCQQGGVVTPATATPTGTPGSPTDTPTEGPSPTVTDTPQEATPTDTATAGPSATATDTPPVEVPTDTPTEGPSDTPTETPTGLPTGTATATATETPTGLPTGTATATVTETPTPTVTFTLPAATFTNTASATPTTPAGPTSTATLTSTQVTVSATPTRTATPTNTSLPIEASIIVGSVTGEPGSTVTFDVTLETDANVAGTQNDIAFAADARIPAGTNNRPSCTVNPAIDKDGTAFSFQPPGCTPGTDCTSIRAIVLALDNIDPIPTDSVLYTCEVAIAEAATGTYPLTCSNPGAGDSDGIRIGADCTDGTVTVAVPSVATIVVGDAIGSAGSDVPLSVSLTTSVSVAGTQNDLVFPDEGGVVAGNNGRPTCSVNPAINKEGTAFSFQPPSCTPGTDCTGVRALVLSLSNVDPIPNGSTLYTCTVAIDASAANGAYPIACTNTGASDPDGNALPTSCVNGDLIVGIQEGTVTPTATRTITATATPTNTPTLTAPPATATSTATRTAAPSNEDDGCQTTAAASGDSAWLLLAPLALLRHLRRRR